MSSGAGPELIETVAGAGDRGAASKADAMAPFRSHAEVCAHPDMLEIEGRPERRRHRSIRFESKAHGR